MMIKIEGRKATLARSLTIHRILPERHKRMVGPFCFLDHMGPVEAGPEQDTDVLQHPHIGLSTLTYFLSGRAVHRDSLGTEAVINAGDVNWMTAGRGIAHSERTHADDRSKTRQLEGLQFWVALPDDKEDIEPSFQHYEAKHIQFTESRDAKITVVAGEGFGLKSPVVVSSELVLIVIEAKAEFDFSVDGFELALYVVSGSAECAGERLAAHQMLVFESGGIPRVEVRAGSRTVILGGKPFATPKHIWWNLVSSSRDKIEAAKRAWRDGSFPRVPGETEFVPLPES